MSARFTAPATLLLIAAGFSLAGPAQALPGFSKGFSPGTIGPGSVSTLSFLINNPDTTPATQLAFLDSLPSGMVVADPARATSSCGGTLWAPSGDNIVDFSNGSLGAGSSCTIQVDVTAASAGTLTNVSGALTSSAGNSGPATANLTVATDRPGFSKAFSPASVPFGGRSTLNFTIDNTANNSNAVNLSFSDPLPVGMVVASPTNATVSGCSGGSLTAIPGSNLIMYGPAFFQDASVAAGASCTLSVDVVGNAVGLLNNLTSELTSFAPTGQTRSSGRASATLAVTSERLSLVKRFTDDPVGPGQAVTLQFEIRNLDRRETATDIAFSDDLDATLTGLSAVGTPIADPCGPGSSLTGSGLLSLSGGILEPEASCTFSVQLTVPSNAAHGVYTNTTSPVTAQVGGSTQVGSPASDQLVVAPQIQLSKTFLDNPVGSGGSVELQFTLTNPGSGDATDIGFSDVFDPVMPSASGIPAADFCGIGSSASFTPLLNPPGGSTTLANLTVTGASLPAGGSCSFSITLDLVTGTPPGNYLNVTSPVTATIDGAAVSGAPAQDTLAVVGGPQLTKEFIDDPVAPGGTVTLQFDLSLSEDSPAAAGNISFSDDLDAVLTGLVASGLPLQDVCGTGSELSGTANLLFTGGSLAPGESCSFSASLAVPADAPAGSHLNTTSSVVADVGGVATSDNPATATLQIAGLSLQKSFVDDPVAPGGNVTLEFTIRNDHPTAAASDILFVDNLSTVMTGLVASGLPLNDVCGSGSSLTGTTSLTFQQGSLAAGESCSFSVVLQVPATAAADVYINRTSLFQATIDGATLVLDDARDELVVIATPLLLGKEFITDPVTPGGTGILRFTLSNLDGTRSISDIAFSDDLDAALSGLVATGLPPAACGGSLSGSGLLALSGAGLAPGETCAFDVGLQIPASAVPGTLVINTTSEVTGLLDGSPVTGDPASDDLRIGQLGFSKAFLGEAHAGASVDLSFTIANLGGDPVSGLSFADDLQATLPGLTATGLPLADVCGPGSEINGSSVLLLTGGNLLPGGSCTMQVSLQVPATASPGQYLNTTSPLRDDSGSTLADPATATLTVAAILDSDGDGILDDADLCPGTVIPEGVPTVRLGVNRYALVDGDGIFDTVPPNGGGPGEVFNLEDTAGCSCEQIIVAAGLGEGHVKFGCSLGAMRNWRDQVSP